MSKNDEKRPPETPQAGQVTHDPPGLHVYRVLADPTSPDAMRPRQAAILALYAAALPDLCADAMTPAEVKGWVSRFGKQNPHAWHASMMGDVARFLRVIGLSIEENITRYQTGMTDMVARANAA